MESARIDYNYKGDLTLGTYTAYYLSRYSNIIILEQESLDGRLEHPYGKKSPK
jgi:hypothetical protein